MCARPVLLYVAPVSCCIANTFGQTTKNAE